jgi:hypothetical protein
MPCVHGNVRYLVDFALSLPQRFYELLLAIRICGSPGNKIVAAAKTCNFILISKKIKSKLTKKDVIQNVDITKKTM